MSGCRFGVSPVSYPDPDPDSIAKQFAFEEFMRGVSNAFSKVPE